MLGNLRDPPEPFGNVIRAHFRLKAPSILKQLDKWLALDDGKMTQLDGAQASPSPGRGQSGSGSEFRRNVDELKSLLATL